MTDIGFDRKVEIAKKSKRYAISLAGTNLIFFAMIQSILKNKDESFMNHKFKIGENGIEIRQSLVGDRDVDVESSEHEERSGPSTTGCPAIHGGRAISKIYDTLLEIYAAIFWKD